MALYDRLLGRDDSGNLVENRLNIHAFTGMMAERARGQVTNAQIITAFSLSASEQTELATLVSRFTTGPTQDRLTREIFEDVMYIAQPGLSPYITPTQVKTRFGV